MGFGGTVQFLLLRVLYPEAEVQLLLLASLASCSKINAQVRHCQLGFTCEFVNKKLGRKPMPFIDHEIMGLFLSLHYSYARSLRMKYFTVLGNIEIRGRSESFQPRLGSTQLALSLDRDYI